MADSSNWSQFWNVTKKFDFIMMKNVQFFTSRIEKIWPVGKDDRFLDIGCGPGFVVEQLHTQVKTVHGLDVSEKFVQTCQEKFKHIENVQISHLDPEDYLNFSQVQGETFDKILLLSVIQYYRDVNEVSRLIENIKPLVANGGQLFIVDIIDESSTLKDAWHFLSRALRERVFFRALKFLLDCRFSNYFDFRSQQGLLSLSDEDIQSLIDKHHLNARIIREPLTYNANRKHLLVTFQS